MSYPNPNGDDNASAPPVYVEKNVNENNVKNNRPMDDYSATIMDQDPLSLNIGDIGQDNNTSKNLCGKCSVPITILTVVILSFGIFAAVDSFKDGKLGVFIIIILILFGAIIYIFKDNIVSISKTTWSGFVSFIKWVRKYWHWWVLLGLLISSIAVTVAYHNDVNALYEARLSATCSKGGAQVLTRVHKEKNNHEEFLGQVTIIFDIEGLIKDTTRSLNFYDTSKEDQKIIIIHEKEPEDEYWSQDLGGP